MEFRGKAFVAQVPFLFDYKSAKLYLGWYDYHCPDVGQGPVWSNDSQGFTPTVPNTGDIDEYSVQAPTALLTEDRIGVEAGIVLKTIE